MSTVDERGVEGEARAGGGNGGGKPAAGKRQLAGGGREAEREVAARRCFDDIPEVLIGHVLAFVCVADLEDARYTSKIVAAQAR